MELRVLHAVKDSWGVAVEYIRGDVFNGLCVVTCRTFFLSLRLRLVGFLSMVDG